MRTNEQRTREIAAYLHGRLEREIEGFAHRFSIETVELTQRVASLLLGIGEWHEGGLSALPVETGERRVAVAEVEGAGQSHGGGAQRQERRAKRGRPSGQAAKNQMKNWPQDPIARMNSSIQRLRKRSDPIAQKMLKGLLKKRRELKRAA